METFFNFLSNNKEWLFSGLGASAIMGSAAYFLKKNKTPKRRKHKLYHKMSQ